MRCVVVDEPGGEDVLRIGEAPEPKLGAEDLRIRVRATSVNRADLLQRMGLYPPPPGASPIIGLECAGEVMEAGSAVAGWKAGDRVMALLSGGGYAEQAVVDAGSALPIPAALNDHEAGAFMEVFLTAFLNIFQIGGLPDGGTALVHGGSSGVGTAAISLLREGGGKAIVTAGSDDRCRRCEEHGADLAINYRSRNFAEDVREHTAKRGVDVVLDCIGGRYLASNLSCLTTGGRLVIIGLMGGAAAEIDLARLLTRRLQVIGSTLRARPAGEKAAIVQGFSERFGDALAAGRLRPVIDTVLPLARVAEAHRRMQAGEHFGKIVLPVAE